MVRFLINRPIAVIMTYIAFCSLGIVAWFRLPVSLMPDIDIPEITVQVNYPNTSAEEIEDVLITHIRRQLMQLTNLNDIQSESRAGNATIHLRFDYGTNINLAYIETNEKIDALMNRLPKDLERPKVIKASATDIPVFYLNISLKEHSDEQFIELSNFCENIIKRHIEQLPQVAMTDMSGQSSPEIIIVPNEELTTSLSIAPPDIKNALTENNIDYGNFLIKNGLYQYHIRFSSQLNTLKDIANIYIRAGGRLLQLKDIAEIKTEEKKLTGMFTTHNKRAISLAIIKQASARMSEMKDELYGLVSYFREQYPELEFEVAQDQTQLLDFSINNLKNSLFIGLILVVIIMVVFLKNIHSAFLSGITIPVSLIVSLLFFMLVGISVNIISLSGLILAVGMMIDNSIIVIDNINQHYERGKSLQRACIEATNEVIAPLLSSALTTSAIFLPLIFLSGISGALFFDQAVTVTIGLIVSFIVSITFLPTLFFLLFKNKSTPSKNRIHKKHFYFEDLYEKGFNLVFNNKMLSMSLFLILFPLAILLFSILKKEKLPTLEQNELITDIVWNENIHLSENRDRIISLFKPIDSLIDQKNCFIGQQQFLMDRENITLSEVKVYIKSGSNALLNQIKIHLNQFMKKNYPAARLSIHAPRTIFEKLFPSDDAPLMAHLSLKNKHMPKQPSEIIALADTLDKISANDDPNKIPVEEYINLVVNFEKLVLYHVAYSSLINKLKVLLNSFEIGNLKTSQQYIPICIGNKEQLFMELLNSSYVTNTNNKNIPINLLVSSERKLALKTIVAGKEGKFIPLSFNSKNSSYESLMQKMRSFVINTVDFDISFSGSLFTQKILFRELLTVLCISLLLLYFILAAQFESIIQPVIVLLEIPIDLAGALTMLWIFDESVNIMAMIGIVVMCGIIINDSILKIDTINRLRKETNLINAIKTGGHRRIRPIIMTSLTTIFALAPFLFGKGMGAELQLPLALTIIGGMIIGTIVSLYFVPLTYWFIYRKNI